MSEINIQVSENCQTTISSLQRELVWLKQELFRSTQVPTDKQVICDLAQRAAVLQVLFEHLADKVARQALTVNSLVNELNQIKTYQELP